MLVCCLLFSKILASFHLKFLRQRGHLRDSDIRTSRMENCGTYKHNDMIQMCRTGSRTFKMVKYKIKCCTVHISTISPHPRFLRRVILPPSFERVCENFQPRPPLHSLRHQEDHNIGARSPAHRSPNKSNESWRSPFSQPENPSRTPASLIGYAPPVRAPNFQVGGRGSGAALRFPSYYQGHCSSTSS